MGRVEEKVVGKFWSCFQKFIKSDFGLRNCKGFGFTITRLIPAPRYSVGQPNNILLKFINLRAALYGVFINKGGSFINTRMGRVEEEKVG